MCDTFQVNIFINHIIYLQIKHFIVPDIHSYTGYGLAHYEWNHFTPKLDVGSLAN